MIELHHVVMRYPGSERAALDDVSLRIEKGDLCLLTGPSGAGKSTLLRLLFGALRPVRGQVIVNGRTMNQLGRAEVASLRRDIGVVFQDFKLLPQATVEENVALTLEVQARSRARIRDRVNQILEQVGLSHKLQVRCAELSGGEQQRVAIARALVGDPAVLLADEPTGNLDPEKSEATMELLSRAHARGTTVLIATHDPMLTERYRRSRISLREGKIVAL
ncbi:MAG: cell division ATP-binding protein FtsE [Myxococcota bacterium]